MRNEVSEDKGFFAKHKRKISAGILATTFYGFFSFTALNMHITSAPIYEEFNPRRDKSHLSHIFNESVDNAIAISGQAIIDGASVPWEVYRLVTHDKYLDTRNRAFEIAGINESHPEDDANRFSFYRKLRVSVRGTNNPNQRVYVPFDNLRNFIEQNSDYRFEYLEEIIPTTGFKLRSTLLGKAFFKADSKSQGGNEDGIVDNVEWSNALNQMNYRTMEYDVTTLLSHSNPREELERLVADIRTNPNYLNTPDILPISRLELYISSN